MEQARGEKTKYRLAIGNILQISVRKHWVIVLQQKHKYYDYRNSTSLYILLWSFFVLSLFCLSCNRQREVDENHVLENEIVGMRKSQMHADNLSFYVHKHKAEEIIGNSIDDDSKIPDDFLKQICEYNLVYVDYLIQTGHRAMACEVMDSVLHKSSRLLSGQRINLHLLL